MNKNIEILAIRKASAAYSTRRAEFRSLFGSRHTPSIVDDTVSARYNLRMALRAVEELRILKHTFEVLCADAYNKNL